ncbi:fumarate reductase/succinate dehydrogenase flavo protein domain-containing protein [Rhizodiscina lignyota]|uniref:Fumarate reductase/succinate dehydrogenase flavo protein domain-containing protein n=1 Tax=Rhizodiscina lignyota TaxID=1504668 RepID=A0A9P4I5S8_9PEZI|nr:fumarate reductase/succinate dehydrogenase flavo protein domain-containing protein [Rhizodiscina lignyota]
MYNLTSNRGAFSSQLRDGDKNIKPDVLIIGSGAAAMTAALRAKSLGLSPLIVEKASKIGGTSAYSGGGLWIPNSGIHSGVDDSPEEALKYLESVVEDVGPASSRERKVAFLENGPRMVKFLADQGYRWMPSKGYPDYFPEAPGGKTGGRTVEPRLFDLNKLGEWKDKLNFNPIRPPTVPMHTFELAKLVRIRGSWEGTFTAMEIFGLRKYSRTILGQWPVTIGVSMTGQLLYLCLQNDIPIWTDSPMKELVVQDGRVTGAVIQKQGGEEIVIDAPKGVLLAAGGFSRNSEMRKRFQAPGISAEWTSASPTDTGEAITAAMNIGAATALLDEAWWGATIVDPATGQPYWTIYERALPHSIIVDNKGQRFTNEAQSYNAFGRALWDQNKAVPGSAVPAYLILDTNHRNSYLLATKFLPGITPQSALDSGMITKAATLKELAEKLSIDDSALQSTVSRFNGFAAKGVDEDFNRGRSYYDNFIGDPTHKPNPNLGGIDSAPFYALRIWPGDLGTKGGVLTDEYGRALKNSKNGKTEVISGLYAVGNSSASVMGRTYAGAGATLGPALTFAYIAAGHMGGAETS